MIESLVCLQAESEDEDSEDEPDYKPSDLSSEEESSSEDSEESNWSAEEDDCKSSCGVFVRAHGSPSGGEQFTGDPLPVWLSLIWLRGYG